jgi:hypothetical protein
MFDLTPYGLGYTISWIPEELAARACTGRRINRLQRESRFARGEFGVFPNWLARVVETWQDNSDMVYWGGTGRLSMVIGKVPDVYASAAVPARNGLVVLIANRAYMNFRTPGYHRIARKAGLMQMWGKLAVEESAYTNAQVVSWLVRATQAVQVIGRSTASLPNMLPIGDGGLLETTRPTIALPADITLAKLRLELAISNVCGPRITELTTIAAQARGRLRGMLTPSLETSELLEPESFWQSVPPRVAPPVLVLTPTQARGLAERITQVIDPRGKRVRKLYENLQKLQG